MELELITGERFGNWEANQELIALEDGILERLHVELPLRERLYPVTEDMLAPGLLLLYPLGKNTFGAHILRSAASGYKYLQESQIRPATQAGRFFTLPDDA